MAKNYLSFDEQLELGLVNMDDMPVEQTSLVEQIDVSPTILTPSPVVQQPVAVMPTPVSTTSATGKKKATIAGSEQAPMCYSCGNQTQRSGSCYVCTTCGSTTGCS
jgi:ribonucleoside-diphosphate reductase alpha chain